MSRPAKRKPTKEQRALEAENAELRQMLGRLFDALQSTYLNPSLFTNEEWEKLRSIARAQRGAA